MTQEPSTRLADDLEFVSEQYKGFNGFEPNLSHPTRLSEKICLQKIQIPKPIFVQCTDKIRVRSFVETRIGKRALPALYFVSKHSVDINAENITNKQFVVKTNNGNGGVSRCFDRNNFDWQNCRSLAENHLNLNYYRPYREMQYRDIEPIVFAEELLISSNQDNDLPDYKFFCFHGEPMLIQVDLDRFTGHNRTFLTPDWHAVDVTYDDAIPQSSAPPDRPDMLAEMIAAAKTLSKGFEFVRVDLYQLPDRVVFGELTFTPGAGTKRFIPDSFEREMGDLWQSGGTDYRD